MSQLVYEPKTKLLLEQSQSYVDMFMETCGIKISLSVVFVDDTIILMGNTLEDEMKLMSL
jgi:hypothetical protein